MPKVGWAICFFVAHIIFATASETFLTPSGILLPFSAIHQHQPSVSLENLPHVIFEYHRNGSLISYHAHIHIPHLVSHSTVNPRKDLSSALFGNSRCYATSSTQPTVKQGHGYTFVLNGDSDALVAAWGPALQLHPVDVVRYPSVFVNAAVIDSPALVSAQGHRTDRVARSFLNSVATNTRTLSQTLAERQRDCGKMWTVTVLVQHDMAFRKQYGGTAARAESALNGLVAHVSRMFEDLACVSITPVSYTDHAITNVPVLQKGCSPNGGSGICLENAKRMMNFTENTLAGTDSSTYLNAKNVHIKFLFSGSTDNSPLFGTTYRSQVCSLDRSVGWVKNANAATLAHEIGHMLGAQHDSEGVMSKTLRSDEGLTLSPKSIVEIDQFISRDPRSWCLKPRPLLNEIDGNKHWIHAAHRVHAPRHNWSMTSTLAFETEAPSKMFLIGSKRNHATPTATLTSQMVHFPEFPCRPKSEARACWKSTYKINIVEKQAVLGSSIAVGRIRINQSTDLIVSRIGFHQGRPIAYYNAILGFKPEEMHLEQWTPNFLIKPFRSENLQCFDVALGYIRPGPTPDIVHVHVDKRLLGTVFVYYVGFDVGPDGTVRGGWSNEIKIPNWHSHRTTSISVEVLDLDNNGMPEIVISQTDESEWGPIPYIRVGMDLDANGHVTNGWTDYVQGFQFNDFSGQNTGAMTLHRFEDCRIGVVLLQQVGSLLDISYRTDIFTPAFLQSAKPHPEVSEWDDGCRECETGMSLAGCRKIVYVCATTIEAVVFVNTDHRIDSTSTRQQRPSAREVPFVSSQSSSTNESLYCEGFRYRLATNRSCETFDRRTVTWTGVLVAFKTYFREGPPTNASLSLALLFNSPVQVKQGAAKLSGVLIRISGEYASYNVAAGRALQKLKYRFSMERPRVHFRVIRDLKRAKETNYIDIEIRAV